MQTSLKLYVVIVTSGLIAGSGSLKADAKDAARYGRQGLEAAKKKDWPEAIENYKKLTEADPKDGKNYIYLGLAYPQLR